MVKIDLRGALALLVLLGGLMICGCGVARQASSTAVIPAGRQGVVHGGQQPVSGATVQLFAVGTSGDGLAATALLSPAVTTDGNGGFTLTGLYTCPSASALVYVVATGGNPGLGGNVNNGALALMAALGPCGNLTGSTNIVINELTTVAAVYALAPFMRSASTVGSGAGDAAALASAFTLAAELVDTAKGASPGASVPGEVVVPSMQINLLGDVLAGCVNSSGGTAGDNTACGNLFSLTTPTTTPATTPAADTVTALLHLADNAALNTNALFNLAAANAPFQPTAATAPTDLTITLGYTSSLTLSMSSLDFAGVTTGFTSNSQMLTLSNNGGNAVQFQNLALSGANPGDFTFQTSPGRVPYCGASTLLPGQSCSFPVQFLPTTTGTRSAQLTVTSSATTPATAVTLTGQGVAPAAGPAVLSQSSLSFNGFGLPQNVMLTNSGNSPLAIAGIKFGSTAFSQTNNCGASLAAQASCMITVTALAGASSSTVMTVVDDAAGGPQTMNVSETSNYFVSFAAFLGVSNAITYNFGGISIGASVSQGVFFNPATGTTLPTATASISGLNPGDFSLASSGQCVPPSGPSTGNCAYIVIFAPTTVGTRTANLTIPGIGVMTLTGTGQPAGINFSVALIGGLFKVTNTGTLPLTLNTPVITGPEASQFYAYFSGPCSTIFPGSSCQIAVGDNFTLSGPLSATLVISDTTGTVQQTESVTGTGPLPGPTVTTTSLSFAAANGTVSAPQIVTVTAPDNHPVTINPPLAAAFQVTQLGSCTHTPCQFSVVFAPTTGNATGAITLMDSITGGYTNIAVNGIGGAPFAALGVTYSGLNFPATPVGATSSTLTVTLSDQGNIPLTLNSITLGGANPGDFFLNNGCGSSLVPFASCSFTVAFSPQATGSRAATVKVVSNSSSSPDIFQAAGTGQ
jgi:hypothetical protein